MRVVRGVMVTVIAALGLGLAPMAAAATAPALSGSISADPNLSGATSVAISGHYAYTTAYYPGELTAVNFANPASPVVAGSSAASSTLMNASTVNIAGGYAYVVSKNRNGPCTPGPSPMCGSGTNDDGSGNSLTILNISTNPAVPQIVGHVTDPVKLFGAYGVAVSGNYAYIAAQGCLSSPQPCPSPSVGNSFEVVDVSHPATPTIVGGLSNPTSGTFTNALKHACSVTVSGHYAYVTAAYSNRLTIIDITNPSAPAIVSSLLDASRLNFPVDVAVQGTYAYVADQASAGIVAVVDVSNPASPQVVATVTDPATLNGAYRIRLSGNFAYVSASSVATVTAIDISDPLNPREAGHVTSSADLNKTTGLDVDPTGNYVVANSPYLSSESNPAFPPFPGGTGSMSVITLDPTPISVNISASPAALTAQTTANFTFAPSDQISSVSCSRDGAPLGFCTSATTQQYSGLALGPHTFKVQATDAAGTSSSASYSWTVGQAPSSSAVTILGPASPSPGDQLSASTGTWPGTPTPTLTYQWSDCNSAGSSCTPIGGAMSSIYTVQGSDLGFKLEVAVTGTNGLGSASAKSALTAFITPAPPPSPAPPANFALPVISGSAIRGQTLTASDGSWSGLPAPSFTYSWADCNSAGTNCSSPISGATGLTYTVRASDVGFTLEITVTGSNGVGSPVSATAPPTAVVSSLPANTALPLISGTAAQGQTLTASTGTWSGTPAPTFTYQWVDCGAPGVPCSPISAATHPSYTLAATDVGATLRVLVLATNSAGSSRSVSAPTALVTVAHPAPAPTISHLRQTAKTWLEAPKPAHTGKPKPKPLPTGTTFSLTLNLPGSLSFRFTLKSNGRKVGGRCRTQTSHNRHSPRCTLKLAAGTLVLVAHKGADKIKFAGRLSHGKKLRPGAYTVAITATAAGKRSKLETLSFTIAP